MTAPKLRAAGREIDYAAVQLAAGDLLSHRGAIKDLTARIEDARRRAVDEAVARLSDELDATPTGAHLPPIMGRWGMRGMDDFTAEELARLQQKLDGWIG